MAKKKNSRNALVRFLFLVYCAVMLWLLFDRPSAWGNGSDYRHLLEMNANFKPLFTIKNYITVIRRNTEPALVRHCVINLAGNVLLFIPAGFLLPRIFPKQQKFFLFLLTCLVSILLVETVQLFSLLGSFDIDDLILNLSGMIIGFAIYRIRYPKQ